MNTQTSLYQKLLAYSIIICLFFPSAIKAQTLVRHLLSPEIAISMLEVDSIKKAKYAQEKELLQSATTTNELEVLTIPIIFHIVYQNELQRVDEQEINNQLAVLNNAFSGQGTDSFEHLAESKEGYGQLSAADTRIRFCLAARADAINYVSSEIEEWGADFGILQQEGGLRLIEPTKYLNVVIAPLADTVSGYSALPWFPEELDGVIIDYRYFGTVENSYPYNEGKTLIHLIANACSVSSLWTNGKCEDDNLIDTPIHNAPNRGCPGYLHVSTCYNNPVELTFNYLDNSDDRCLKSFTKSQVSRMRKVLNVLRKGWISEGESACGNEGHKAQEVPNLNRSNKVSNELKSQAQLQIRPNPANGQIEILVQNAKDLSEQEGQIRIFTASGKAIYTGSFSLNGILLIDSSMWSPGLYFVKSKIGIRIQTQTLAIAR